MATPTPVVVGVDVGGTNTDAVVIAMERDRPTVLADVKELTTSDVTTGVRRAVMKVLKKAFDSGCSIGVVQVNIGTTHFVNAAVQGKDLARVTVLRLCGTVSQALPPFSDFPKDLKEIICSSTHLLSGGYRYDGKLIDEIKREEIEEVVKNSQTNNFVVCGVFSPIRSDQEQEAERIIKEINPDASVTLSYNMGHLGLLDRENAAVLNECLKPLCRRTIDGFREALKGIGLECSIFLTQNDGTIISSEKARDFPVYTFASGPTNSMRGAAFLSEVKDAIVVDVGGTTTDVGVLKNGFPREASSHVKVGGIRTNFRMPDVLSIGLGGGSYVVPAVNDSSEVTSVKVGPRSAGFNLKNEALVFSNTAGEEGRSLTATDIAVAAGLFQLGNRDFVKDIQKNIITKVIDKIHEMVEEAIDKVKLSDELLPVILVGGGSILLDRKKHLKGASEVLLPENFGVANAIGAALSQVSGSVDNVVSILDKVDRDAMETSVRDALAKLGDNPDHKKSELVEEIARKPYFVKARDEALEETISLAKDKAVRAGADAASLEVSEKQDMTLAYMPGQVTRIKVKVIGKLAGYKERNAKITKWEPKAGEEKEEADRPFEQMHNKQEVSSSGQKLTGENSDTDNTKTPMDPHIDPLSGEWILSPWDVECIVVGAGIFGCGGGGNPHLGRLRALETIKKGGKIRIITPERLLKDADPENDLVSIVNFYGAPLIMYEQLVSSKETSAALKCIEDVYNVGGFKDGTLSNKEGVVIEEKDGMRFISNYQKSGGTESKSPNITGKKIKALMAVEIGGMNAIEPYLVGADLGLPIVDADAMGRAFPKVSMMTPYMYGLPAFPAAIVDDKNRRAVMLETPNATLLEHHFRDVVTEMGCSAGCSFAPLVKEEVLTKCVQHTVSRSWRLGNAILRARLDKTSPIEAILATETSIHVLTGKIRDVQTETSGGYNKGRVIIEGLDQFEGQKILLNFQNEHLVIIPLGEDEAEGEVIACVPDLITLVDADTAEPITTDEVRYGLRVAVLVIASQDILRTETALRYVSPQAFLYPENVKFKPFGESKPIVPIPPLS